MALCLLYSDELKIGVTKEQRDFIISLEKNQAAGERGLRKRKDDLRFTAYSDGLRYIAGLYGFVNAVKSFLDVYANLMGKLISPSSNWSFKRGNIEGKSLAGGKIIKWLDNCSPKNFPRAVDLARTTRLHSENWMTSLVSYRDDLSHYRDPIGFVHMHVPLRKEAPWFRENEISGPYMPNGETVEEYCSATVTRLSNYIRETVVMLPLINSKLISVERFLKE